MIPNRLFCFTSVWWATACVLLSGIPASAQINSQNASSQVYVDVAGNPAGLRSFASSRWGLVSVIAGNDTDKPQRVSPIVSVDGAESLRFSRNVLVPPKSIRRTTIPIYLPPGLPADSTVEFTGVVSGENLSAEAKRRYVARVVDQTATAFIDDEPLIDTRDPDKFNFHYEAAIAVREAVGLSRVMSMTDDRSLPATVEGWDAFNSVIISGNRLGNEPAARQALRQWLAEGGRLWLQADLMTPETVRLLLGSTITVQEIDRVSLDNFEIAVAAPDSLSFPTQVTVENPVNFVRCLIEGAKVLYEIDGWPAMVKFNYGQGDVYLTTLEGRGWLRRRGSDDMPFSDPKFYTDFMALPPLQDLAIGLKGDAYPDVIPESTRAEYVNQRIGYEIPERKFVIGVLLGFCGIIGVAGLILGVIGYREHLVWVTLGSAVAASAVVVASGLGSRGSVPSTAASVQVVEVHPQTGEVAISGSVGFYQPDLAPANLASTGTTRIDPQSDQLANKIRTFVWEDAARWRWDETILPASVQLINYHRSVALRRPVTVTAQFGPEGLMGTINTDGLSNDNAGLQLTDCVIIFPHAAPLAAKLNDGLFTVGIDDVLPPGEFLASAFVDSNQRERGKLYQALYESFQNRSDRRSYLVGWSESMDTGLKWGSEVKISVGSLVVIPLTITEAVSGSRVVIPGSAIRARAGISSIGKSSVFEDDTQSWVYPFGRPTISRIRYQLPDGALPIQIDEATVAIDCNIPSRALKVEIIDYENGVVGSENFKRRLIIDRTNVSGKIKLDLMADGSLATDSEGGITLEYTIGELTSGVDQRVVANSNWSIRSARVDLSGTIPRPVTEENPQ